MESRWIEMLSNVKKYAFYVILIFLIVVLWFMYEQNKDLKSQSAQKDAILQERQAEIFYRRNKEGEIIASKLAVEASMKNIKEYYREETEKIVRDFDIKLKNTQSFLSAQIATSNKGHTTLRDTVYYPIGLDVPRVGRTFSIRERYMVFDGVIFDDGLDYSYTYYDTLSFVTHWKRDKFFAPKRLYVDGKSENPNSSIEGIRNISVNNFKRPRFSIGPYVGYGTTGINIGVGLQYSVISF
jgi:hypothetical protein